MSALLVPILIIRPPLVVNKKVKLILQAQASKEDIDRLSQPVKNLVHYLFSLNKEATTVLSC